MARLLTFTPTAWGDYLYWQGRDKKTQHRINSLLNEKLSSGLWTPHDLRRTGATLMTVLGVLPVVTERCLNHTEQNKVMRIYQRYGYEAEKREAWHKLGERLALLTRLDADNVVILRAFNQ